MDTKIKWFKEFLQLEPNSKIFFPLARLLAEEGDQAEAVAVLKKGVERHPDYLEARFLLVQLLKEQGQDDTASQEAEGVASTLSQYPSFWQVWAERSAPQSRDSALALSFLASTFRGKSITWSQVIEEGLRAIFAEAGGQVCAPLRHLEPEVLGEVEFAPPPPMEFLEEEDFSLPELPTPPPLEVGAEAAKAYPAESPEQAIASVLADESVAPDDYYSEMPALAEEPQAPESGEAKAAEPSLRTRTMADLLAEQGDHKGALEIYQELAAAAAGPEAEELLGQAARMQAKMRRGGADPQAEKPIPPMPGKERLLTVLESLAERLESRARA